MACAIAERDATNDASAALATAADILKNRSARQLSGAPARYAPALWTLYVAVTGRSENQPVDGRVRLGYLELASKELRPAIRDYGADPDQLAWLEAHVEMPLLQWHKDLQLAAAYDRVEKSALIDRETVFDAKLESDPRAQALALHQQMPKLRESILTVSEMVTRANDHGVDKAVKEMLAGKLPPSHRHLSSLAQLHSLLELAEGLLTLTDDEFHARLDEAKSVAKVATYVEFVKSMVAVVGGAVAITAGGVALVANLAGNTAVSLVAKGIAVKIATTVSDVVTIIGAVQSLVTVFDSSKSRQDRIDAAVDVASKGLWIFRGEGAASAALGAASFAVAASYVTLKLALVAYWGSSIGLVSGMMRPALERLHRDGLAIAQAGDLLLKAQLLVEQENDPMEKRALAKVVEIHAQRLGAAVDSLIDDAVQPVLEAGMANQPGAYPILREALAPVMRHKGARTPEAAASAATVALERIKWVMSHAPEVIQAQHRRGGVKDAERLKQENEERAREQDLRRLQKDGVV